MNNKVVLMAAIALIATSSFVLIDSIAIQPAEAASGPGCSHQSGATTEPAVDPTVPNSVNTEVPPPSLAAQPTV
jgi:hypothetical protein